MSSRRRGRRPGESSARADILEAARARFAERGYERTTLRAIAGDAGVDPSLISHYFGSKEGLLREALRPPEDLVELVSSTLASAPHDRVGEEFVATAVSVWDRPAMRPVIAGAFRSAVSRDRALLTVQELIRGTVIAALENSTTADQPRRRAQLVAVHMMGILAARYVFELQEIVAMTPEEVARAVGPSIQRLLFDPI